MSADPRAVGVQDLSAGRLWWRQALAAARLELRQSFFGRRAVLLWLLALIPVALLLVFGLVPLSARESESIGWAARVYAAIYEGFILRFVVYFGCVWAFTNLFRGEVLDRSLHYWLLTPVRREVLVAGKFGAAFAGTLGLFGGATLVSNLLLYLPYGTGTLRDYLLGGPGLGQLLGYLAMTTLACLGYGAVFLLIGLLVRNPILPAGAILLWEFANFLLPPALKRLSVIHYVKALSPLPMSEGPFALVGEPPPAWVSVGGLLLLAALFIVLAGLRIRRYEVSYGD